MIKKYDYTWDAAHNIGTRNILPRYFGSHLLAEADSKRTDPQILVFCIPDSKLIVRRCLGDILKLSNGRSTNKLDTPKKLKVHVDCRGE